MQQVIIDIDYRFPARNVFSIADAGGHGNDINYLIYKGAFD
jgi:hypothetical protein